MRRRVTKVVLKEAARGLLPDAVVDQQKVGFFNAAMSQWIVSRGRQELEARFLETDPASAELFDRQELSRLVREDGRGEGAHSRLLIAILMLELWLSTVLAAGDGRGGCSSRRMSARSLSYAIVTPARNEATNLPRLAACLVEQTVQPSAWVIVDDGSTDGTAELAERLADAHSWMKVVTIEGDPTPARGGPIVRAFTAGLEHVDPSTDVVAKLDADLSFPRITGSCCWRSSPRTSRSASQAGRAGRSGRASGSRSTRRGTTCAEPRRRTDVPASRSCFLSRSAWAGMGSTS